jgi:hypothetical protein
VEQSTIWNYYVTRLSGGSCQRKDKACTLATRCLALGPTSSGPQGVDASGSVDPDHPHGSDAPFDKHAPRGAAVASPLTPWGGASLCACAPVVGCNALFTNDFAFPKPKFNTRRASDPETFGEEVPAPPGVPSPLARWVDKALTGPCDKHSHKVANCASASTAKRESFSVVLSASACSELPFQPLAKLPLLSMKPTWAALSVCSWLLALCGSRAQVTSYVNKTRRDLEDAKDVLGMFDAVLVSERLGEPGVMLVMEAVFGAAAKGMEFPNANRGLFTHGGRGVGVWAARRANGKGR